MTCYHLPGKRTLKKSCWHGITNQSGGVGPKAMTWTASKAGLVEMIYSLQSYGAFNNGAADIKGNCFLPDQSLSR